MTKTQKQNYDKELQTLIVKGTSWYFHLYSSILFSQKKLKKLPHPTYHFVYNIILGVFAQGLSRQYFCNGYVGRIWLALWWDKRLERCYTSWFSYIIQYSFSFHWIFCQTWNYWIPVTLDFMKLIFIANSLSTVKWNVADERKATPRFSKKTSTSLIEIFFPFSSNLNNRTFSIIFHFWKMLTRLCIHTKKKVFVI